MKSKSHRGKTRISAEIATGSVDDLVQAIKDDHDDLRKFIEVMKDEDAELKEKKHATEGFMSLLKSHSSSEEKALYERCLKVEDLRVLADEGFVEHAVASSLMKSMPATRNRDRWLAQVKVLAELVEHHIEEEESDFLPEVEKQFTDAKQEKMAHEFFSLRKRSQRNISGENAGVLGAG
jgi:hemerythrin-like domain-containing protein